ncbi:MAG: glycosyltransferase family 2 protein, partial [Candidatus Eremiobacteraeota bacterium]|nr:glycosyltransferase family 2 protein [Candidatus Eremiobacteraeota bacterium]
MRATIQLCTFNRARLLERVLDACFEQTVPAAAYEVVLVNDGSTDETRDVIARAQSRASCRFIVVDQPNCGLAKGRNNGIAHAGGERIIFIDDDVLPLPNFVEQHMRSHDAHPLAVVRGAAINVETFDELPPPVYTLRNYSGNFFWTT